MSDASAAGFGDFGKWVPGFEFLQSLTRPSGASAAAPGNWVAPTLSVEDLDKRIQELKAVLFWLEQNGTALKATIQALEVQKMTLSALKGMNVSLQDMAQAFGAKAPPAAAAASTAPGWPPAPAAASPVQGQAEPPAATTSQKSPPPKSAARSQAGKSRAKASSQSQAGGEAAGMVDPMQWWGALTQQFQQIASAAMADAQARAAEAPPADKPAGDQRAAPSRTPRSPRKSKPKASR
jgi:hypothetical protein